ncbi:hypothetical protein A8924_2919 [Saccharopolyspora erythraea NRRL 2338]|nr:hypothetical protein A8924_2919 [Saccharopolyspora erythraea NRRL 2338]
MARGGEESFLMKRTVRALAGVVAAAALAAVPAAAQAAGPVDGAAEWTLHFDGLSGTPSPKDAVSNWSGKCPAGTIFTIHVYGEAVGGFREGVACTGGTYRVSFMHYDYYDAGRKHITKGQTYKAIFLSDAGGAEAQTVIE